VCVCAQAAHTAVHYPVALDPDGGVDLLNPLEDGYVLPWNPLDAHDPGDVQPPWDAAQVAFPPASYLRARQRVASFAHRWLRPGVDGLGAAPLHVFRHVFAALTGVFIADVPALVSHARLVRAAAGHGNEFTGGG